MKTKNDSNKISIDEVRQYWNKENIPQQWYSAKTPLTIQWFNEIEKKRFNLYYPYLKDLAEFTNHSGEKVLEIGVGLGTDLLQYAKNGANVYGIDLGEDQIELTRKHFAINNLKFECLKVGSAENLEFEDKFFDLIYCFGVLHHTPNTSKAVEEIYRTLKDDGEAIVMLYAKGWKHYIKRFLIHGIFKAKILRYKFDYQKICNEISEVNGYSPKTDIYTSAQVHKLFNKFGYIEIHKCRMGEFFDYKPYNSYKFPIIITKLFYFFQIQSFLGENYLIKLSKQSKPKEKSIFDIIFNVY